jgi:hypothetical protein
VARVSGSAEGRIRPKPLWRIRVSGVRFEISDFEIRIADFDSGLIWRKVAKSAKNKKFEAREASVQF